jgi:UDP-3-O-acyl-N-acetylglucosamine deacetylase
VSIRFAHADVGEQIASYRFDEASFLEQIAPARTFGFFAEWSTLLASGRARGVDPRAVVIFDEPGSPRSAPVTRDEPVRHKMLDLIGDCALFGGPFDGVLEASAPGHARTHAFLARAIDSGALERWA